MFSSSPCCPLVSVIVPAYNAATFICQTLDSVLHQTYRNIEVIVVDDGSQDHTVQIVEAVVERDDRVVLLRQPNGGVAAARNLAIERSSGEYVAPIDADDIWFPEKIERQVQCFLAADSSVGLVYSWWVSINEEGLITYAEPQWDVEGAVYEALIYCNFIGNGSVPLIRRTCLERVGGYNSELRAQGGQGCEDWDLALRIAEHYQFSVAPGYLVGYRSVTNSMSKDTTEMGKSYELVMEGVRRRHSEIPDEIYRWSASLFWRTLAGVNQQSGNYQGIVQCGYKALRSDHEVILAVGVMRMIVANLLRTAAKPLVSAIWPRHDSCPDSSNIFTGNDTLSKLEADNMNKPFSPLWWKPYRRTCLYRWRQITQQRRAPATEC